MTKRLLAVGTSRRIGTGQQRLEMRWSVGSFELVGHYQPYNDYIYCRSCYTVELEDTIRQDADTRAEVQRYLWDTYGIDEELSIPELRDTLYEMMAQEVDVRPVYRYEANAKNDCSRCGVRLADYVTLTTRNLPPF